jgi:hypothetical protein
MMQASWLDLLGSRREAPPLNHHIGIQVLTAIAFIASTQDQISSANMNTRKSTTWRLDVMSRQINP